MIYPVLTVPEADRALVENELLYWLLVVLPAVAVAGEVGPVYLRTLPGWCPRMLNDRHGWVHV